MGVGNIIQPCIGIIYLYRNFIALAVILICLIVFLAGRKRHGKLFTGITLGVMSLSIAVI